MAEKEAYQNRWQKEHTDRVIVQVPKGKKEIIKKAADGNGESINKYINRLIDEDLEAHPVD